MKKSWKKMLEGYLRTFLEEPQKKFLMESSKTFFENLGRISWISRKTS